MTNMPSMSMLQKPSDCTGFHVLLVAHKVSQRASHQILELVRLYSHVPGVLARVDTTDAQLSPAQAALGLLRDVGRADKIHPKVLPGQLTRFDEALEPWRVPCIRQKSRDKEERCRQDQIWSAGVSWTHPLAEIVPKPRPKRPEIG